MSSDNLLFEVNQIDPTPWLEMLDERFGIPATCFEDYIWHQPNAKLISLVHHTHKAPAKPAPISIGLPFIRVKMRFPKMTTGGTLLVGLEATRHVIELDEEQVSAYYSRATHIPLEQAQLEHCDTMGYVIVRHSGVVLGQGFYRPETSEHQACFDSFYPKAAANHSQRSALG